MLHNSASLAFKTELSSAFTNTATSSELPTFLSARKGSIALVTTSLAFNILEKSSSSCSFCHSGLALTQSERRILSRPFF